MVIALAATVRPAGLFASPVFDRVASHFSSRLGVPAPMGGEIIRPLATSPILVTRRPQHLRLELLADDESAASAEVEALMAELVAAAGGTGRLRELSVEWTRGSEIPVSLR